MNNVVASGRAAQERDTVLKLRREYQGMIDYLRANATSTEEGKRRLRDLEQRLVPWREGNDGVMEAAMTGKRMDVGNVTQEQIIRFDGVKSALADYVEYRQRASDRMEAERKAKASKMKTITVWFALFSVITAIVLARVLTLSIVKPLSVATSHLDHIAQGDVSGNVPAEFLERKDEIGMLARGMQAMSESVRDILQDVASGVQVLSSSSAELSANSGQMSKGGQQASENAHAVAAETEQVTTNVASVAAGMEQTTTNLTSVASATEQMTATIGEIASNSEKARRVTEEATRQAVRISEQMDQLGQAARQIGKVTETITEISSQTNLLALNATIEAHAPVLRAGGSR